MISVGVSVHVCIPNLGNWKPQIIVVADFLKNNQSQTGRNSGDSSSYSAVSALSN